MNLFILDKNPERAAQAQCDKHVVKMIVESAQMLSTAHRMLDGTLEKRLSSTGKTQVKYWKLDDDREQHIYKACHTGHPCTKWTMETHLNYQWHVVHFVALCAEYSYRYGKKHKTMELIPFLRNLPKNIPHGGLTKFRLAMKSNPECIYEDDPVRSYREFYKTKKARFAMNWTKRPIPEWFEDKQPEVNEWEDGEYGNPEPKPKRKRKSKSKNESAAVNDGGEYASE